MTILSFAAVFAGTGAGAGGDRDSMPFLVLGVFAGSALWWLLLSVGAGLFRSKVGSRGMRAVNLVSGVLILAFGVAALPSAVW